MYTSLVVQEAHKSKFASLRALKNADVGVLQ